MTDKKPTTNQAATPAPAQGQPTAEQETMHRTGSQDTGATTDGPTTNQVPPQRDPQADPAKEVRTLDEGGRHDIDPTDANLINVAPDEPSLGGMHLPVNPEADENPIAARVREMSEAGASAPEIMREQARMERELPGAEADAPHSGQ